MYNVNWKQILKYKLNEKNSYEMIDTTNSNFYQTRGVNLYWILDDAAGYADLSLHMCPSAFTLEHMWSDLPQCESTIRFSFFAVEHRSLNRIR